MKHDEAKQRFWDHLVGLNLHSGIPNNKLQAHTLFCAIDAAYTSMASVASEQPVHRELLQYLAGWGRESIREGEQRGGVVGSDTNHYLKRAYNGFFLTICHAIKEGLIWQRDDEYLYNCLELPEWLVDMCKAEAEAEADHIRGLRERYPDLRRPYLANNS